MSEDQKQTARIRASSRVVALLLLGAAAAVPGEARGQDAIALGRAYIASRQLPSGWFQGATATDVVEALGVVEDADARQRALLALMLAIPDNTETAIARLVALAGSAYVDPLSSEAHRLTLAAGELGLAPGSVGRDPLVLVWALRLALVDPDFAPLAPGLGLALAGLARPDGGFGFADNDSDLALTAQVVTVLRPLGPLTAPQAAAATSWVLSSVTQADPAQLAASELALALLACADQLAPGQVASLSAGLAGRQDANGAFDSDLRSTALAIAALRIAQPDLGLEIPLVLDTTPTTGSTYEVAVRITNGGSATSPPTTVRYSVTDSSGTVVSSGDVAVTSLAPGESVQVQLGLGVQGAVGSRLLTAVVNPDEAFAERNLVNNVATLGFEVLGRPDLVIESSDVSATPIPPPLHQAIEITVRVRNLGPAIARNVHLQLFLGDPGAGGTLVAEEFLNAVALGTPRLLVTQVVPRSLSPMHLVARVDPENSVSELNEANNEAYLDLTPVEGAKLLTDVTPLLNMGPLESFVQGTKIGMYFGTKLSEKRYGTEYPIPETWPFEQILTVLSVGPPGAETELKRQVVPKSSISAGGGVQENISFSTSGFDGPLTFSVHADADDAIAEDDETNNVASKTITITTPDLPELWIDPATVHVDPPLVDPGAVYVVHGTIRNTGRQSATGIRVDLGTATVTVPALAPGDAADVPVTLTAGAAGTYPMHFMIDPWNAITEGSRANNSTPVTVYVGRSDLEIASVAIDPDPVVEGAAANVTVTFHNIGSSPETGTVTASVLRNGATLATSAPVAYPNPGEFAYVTLPVSTAGMLGDTDAVVRLVFSSWTNRVVERAFVLPVRNPDFGVSPRGIQIVRSPIEHSEDVQATVVVNNTGTAAGTTSVRIYRGYREQGDLAASGALTIPAGGSAVFQSGWFPLTATAAAVVTAVLDEEDAVLEPNEGDNLAVRDVLKAPGEIIVAFDESRPSFYTISTNPVTVNSANAAGGLADWARDLEARGFTIRSINPGEDGVTSRSPGGRRPRDPAGV